MTRVNWECLAPKKVKIFFWILRHERTRTRASLHRHGARDSPDCPFCSGVAEEADHLFVTCPRLVDLWSRLQPEQNPPLPSKEGSPPSAPPSPLPTRLPIQRPWVCYGSSGRHGTPWSFATCRRMPPPWLATCNSTSSCGCAAPSAGWTSNPQDLVSDRSRCKLNRCHAPSSPMYSPFERRACSKCSRLMEFKVQVGSCPLLVP
ncbi:hypothetical protein HU200_065103 [Digitaria exilis]|uniref:Reverse transcriptase zinc-binding domain-containing protein n=1 Tax=Digitaria exilis TaxID=1010633 RepID=A0A834ZZ48_9POAL|nr:hypothetical protein HU200_065103 [Digitaria exilis]